MYDWVRALLDPVNIVHSPWSRNGRITPPPKFELPMDKPKARSAKDVLSTPSTVGAYDNLQKTLEITPLMEATKIIPLPAKTDADEIEVKLNWEEDML